MDNCIKPIERTECTGSGGRITYYIQSSDVSSFELNEKGEICKINLKRVGTYHGKRYERKFISLTKI